MRAEPPWYALLLTRSLVGYRPLPTTIVAAAAPNLAAYGFAGPGHTRKLLLVDGEAPGSRSPGTAGAARPRSRRGAGAAPDGALAGRDRRGAARRPRGLRAAAAGSPRRGRNPRRCAAAWSRCALAPSSAALVTVAPAPKKPHTARQHARLTNERRRRLDRCDPASARRYPALGDGLADDPPARLQRRQEVRGLIGREAFVVEVVLDVAGGAAVAAERSDDPAELLPDRPVDVEVPERVAAGVVVDEEGVAGGQDRGVDPGVFDPGFAPPVSAGAGVVHANEACRDQAERRWCRVGALPAVSPAGTMLPSITTSTAAAIVSDLP